MYSYPQLAEAEVSLSGRVPDHEIIDLKTKIDKIWLFESAKFSKVQVNLRPPEVHFSQFVLRDESLEWRSWQRSWIQNNAQLWREWVELSDRPDQEITSEWIAAHIDNVLPFPASFLAFHYVGTNKIQINSDLTYFRFYQNNASGVKQDFAGYGFYVTAHEMLHYVFEQNGIPGRIHHCLFISSSPRGPSLMAEIADFLIVEGVSAPIIRMVGVRSEESLKPCNRLTREELIQVNRLLETGI